MIRPYRGIFPKVANSAYIDQAATVIGDVTMGERSSVWPGAVLRGDVNRIVLGDDTNIQDGSVLHGELDRYPVILGSRVTVGHMACLHGCVVEDDVLVGIGAIVLNGATVGQGSIIAAGTLVPEGMQIPPGSMVMGVAGQGAPRSDRRRESALQRKRPALHPLSPAVPRRSCALSRGRGNIMIKAVRGTRDILPPSSALWNHVEAATRQVFRSFHYHEVRTPIFEETALFARGVGEETDIVSKEMYTWEDRDGSSLTLRPENTASVIRAYIEHRLDQQPGLKKFYYIGPMFRRERPQKGRYRQFSQIGAEAIGSESPVVDAEVIELALEILSRCGVRAPKLIINSVGCPKCRPAFLEALRGELQSVKDTMCTDCQRRADSNPLRVLDCKVPEDQNTIDSLPSILNHLCAGCAEHFETVRSLLDARGIDYEIRSRLVRGLDYYTRTTFEVVHGALGAQNAILGGGRYDGLAESLGSRVAAPGIGFSIGEDRLIMAVEEHTPASEYARLDVFLIPMGDTALRHAALLARDLRRSGVVVELSADHKVKRAMETANKLAARFALILGDNEIAAGTYALKTMASGEQQSLSREELFKAVR